MRGRAVGNVRARSGVVGLLVLLLASGTACGTRVGRDAGPAVAPLAQASALGRNVAPSEGAILGGGAGLPGQPAASVAGAAVPGPVGGSAVAPVEGMASGGTTVRSPTSGNATPNPPAAGTRGNAPPAASSDGTNPGAPAGSPVAGVPSSGQRITLASVGNYSGPAALAAKPILDGAQLWAKATNARGGLNGHPVEFIVFDDNSDPARHRAQIQEAVERYGVIAFLANAEAVAGEPSLDYIDAKRVPVIGGSSAEQYAYRSPMYFVQMSHGAALARTFTPSIARQAIPRGLTKVGTLVCVEQASCNEIEKEVATAAAANGLKAVYKGRTSITQPDFTAECLAARNAGAEIILVVLDPNSIRRVAKSCNRQSYKPMFAIIGVAQDDSMKDTPELDGTVVSTGIFPYLQTGTPATDEFHRARQTYSAATPLSVGLAAGWTAGKLLERAAARLPEPPTREGLLAALWTIKSDNLGGLSYPLSFTENQPAKQEACWFDIALHQGSWVSPDGYKLHCLTPAPDPR